MSIMFGTSSTKLYKVSNSTVDESRWPVMICLLGNFRLLKAGQPITLRNAIKTKALLVNLALEKGYCIAREAILQTLWPNTDITLAGQSLNSLIYSLRKLLSDTIGGESPILHNDDCYRLNIEAGIGVDADWFETLAHTGEQHERAAKIEEAVSYYRSAVNLYRGDLCIYTDTQSMVIAESLRAHYLTLLARLADYYFATNDLSACLEHAQRLLAIDPCREDAHRVVMRCYTRQGERTQALRQYRLCETVLRSEFDTTPEGTTTALYDQIRLSPGNLLGAI